MKHSLLLAVLFLSGTLRLAAQFVPRFIPSDSLAVLVPEDQDFQFGYLEVLENRSDPDGPSIQLPVYIFKSRHANPKPNPVLLTMGGPGNSSLGAAPYMNYYRYLDDRDLILFEQRGTRYARPSLSYPEWSQAAQKAKDPRIAIR